MAWCLYKISYRGCNKRLGFMKQNLGKVWAIIYTEMKREE